MENNSDFKSQDTEVSVIIPMYNVEELIKETINSLKKNKCKAEFILINDGSSDNTLEVARKTIGEDSRFILINKENSGVSATRNIGLNKAKGEFIFFMDSDDILPDNALDYLLLAARKHSSDFVYGTISRFNSKKVWITKAHDESGLFTEGYKNITKNKELFLTIAPFAKLIHRSLLENIRFPEDIGFAEDQVVVFSTLTSAKSIYCIERPIYLVREREGSNLSITQQRETKAFIYLNDTIKSIKISMPYLYMDHINRKFSETEKKFIISSYLERVFRYEIYPLFLRVLKFQNKWTRQSFELLYNFLSQIDNEFLNLTPAIRFYFIKNLIDYSDYIPVNSFGIFRKLEAYIIDNLNEKVISICASPEYYGQRWIDAREIAFNNYIYSFYYFIRLRLKKKIFRFLNKNSVAISKKIFYLFKLLPIDNKKIIFATAKKGLMSENFTAIANRIRADKEKAYKIKKFLGISNSLKRNLYRSYHLATAKNIILEDYYRPIYGLKFKNSTNVIQTWHACGAFKKFGFSALDKEQANTEIFELQAHKSYTHIIASSPNTKTLYEEAFNAPSERVFSYGVPRTDYFFDMKKNIKNLNKMYKNHPYSKNKINILYAPTFRGDTQQRKRFNLPFSWSIFDELPENYCFFIKLHPIVNTNNIKIPEKYKNKVKLVDSSETVNDWMILCDILITDYSSIIFEYSLTDKPIIFFPFDINDYFDERGFYYNYDTYTFGDVIYDQKDLIDAILIAYINSDKYEDKRREFIEKFMISCDGNAANRIYNNIIKGNY